MALTFAVEYGDARHKALCALLQEDGHDAVLTGAFDERGVLSTLPPGGDIAVAPKLSVWARKTLKDAGMMCVEYQNREECVLAHAAITAENALCLAMLCSGKTLTDSRVLIIGFGRIGKEMCRMLRGIGCNPACAARSKKDILHVKALGITAIDISELTRYLSEYELIINTVPAMVLDDWVLKYVSTKAKIIDLASHPGGVDFGAAAQLGIYTMHALALPGKMTPLSSAAAIRDTIYNILAEEGIT